MKLTHPIKSSRFLPRVPRRIASAIRTFLPSIAALCALALDGTSAQASIAYGSINNFDTVNDTGSEAHGFEIEIDDIHSKDITYTYDYNHYGIPKITEDNSDPVHPKVFVRYAGTFANGVWSAYTAIPAGPIAPTQGHQFTNPSVNFGGEHFGVGYTAAPSAVKYNWLIDDGSHNLIHGPPVNVSTPTFAYVPPVNAVPAQVVAVVVPPPPPAPPVLQFGKAVWVKEIKTKTHSANKIALVDLVGDDPGKPQPWANGVDAADPTQIEVEVEWRILQTDFKNAANAKGVLQGAAEKLPHGNEVITRRYEFYKYTGPLDYESGEAVADTVAADGKHGAITVTYNSGFDPATGELIVSTVDTRTIEIVGDFFGAQMSAFDVDARLGLIDHLQDGELNAPYVERKVVVAGSTAFDVSTTGALSNGMSLDPVSGVLSGTPTQSGLFTFDVSATDLNNVTVKKTYTLAIANNGVLPPSSNIVTSASPDIGGSTKGGGSYFNGANVSVVATPNAGYTFVNWTENGAEVSASATYNFVAGGDRALVANFVPAGQNYAVSTAASPANLGTTSGDGSFANDSSVTVNATANAGAAFVAWTEGGNVVSNSASYTFNITTDRTLVANLLAIYDITTSASPANGGSTNGGGSLKDGASVTVTATSNAGYAFANWTEAGMVVSTTAAYSFIASANRALVANFTPTFTIGTTAAPVAGGTTTGGGSVVSGANVTVTATPNTGFAFVNWSEGGTPLSNSPSYTFTAAGNRTLVANFQAAVVVIPAGAFKGIVANLASPTAAGTGLITITTSGSTGNFTGSLMLGATTYAFKGKLDSAGHATVAIPRKGTTALVVDLQFDAVTGFAGSITGGAITSTFAARRCPYSKANPLAEWPGSYTHIIGFPRRQRPPLPVATGTHTISATGAVRIAGKLSDGTSYICSSNVTDAGTFALFAATKLPGFAGFVVSEVALNAANVGSMTAGSPLTWQPATSQAFGRFAFYFDRYTPPTRGKAALKVDAGVPNLDILSTNAVGGMLASWKMMLRDSNIAVDLGAGPGPISLRITATTGVFEGKLKEGSAQRTFTGVVWQSANGGVGILPGFGDQASLTITATYTGQ